MKDLKKGDNGSNSGSGSADASAVSSDVIKQVIDRAVDELCAKLGISKGQVLQLLRHQEKSVLIPVSIFSNSQLSGLELVCKYLRDNLSIRFSDIARLLSRDYRTVWATYSIANRKCRDALAVPKGECFFPVFILANRELSVLEAIVSYLKDELGLRFSEIAAAMHRDQRNVWTVYSRARKKLQEKEKDGK